MLRVQAMGDLILSAILPSIAKVGVFFAALACAGCALMPATGPQSFEVTGLLQGEPVSLPFALVKLEPPVLKTLGHARPRLSTAFANRTPPRAFRFGIGDTVSVTIFEAAAGGLFIPAEAGVRPGNFVTIPNQAVDNNGNISVPYAGNIPARGKTPVEISRRSWKRCGAARSSRRLLCRWSISAPP